MLQALPLNKLNNHRNTSTMNIIIFGATGNVGNKVVTEAIARGHSVTAVSRQQAKLQKLPKEARRYVGNIDHVQEVKKMVPEQTVIISAIRAGRGNEQALLPMTKKLLSVAQQTNQRILLVGGAGSLIVPDSSGRTVNDHPHYRPSPEYQKQAEMNTQQLTVCQRTPETNWVYISPPAHIKIGERTGKYRIGNDELLIDSNGNSTISFQDLAVAIIDEVEAPKHHQQRFTVAY